MATWIGDFANQAVVGISIPAQAALTTTTTGSAVDLLLAEGPVTLMVNCGVVDFTTTDETYVFKLTESATSGGTYTDITGATTSVTATGTTKMVTTTKRTLQFIKVVATLGGTTPSFLGSAVVLAQKKILGGSGTVL